MPTPAPRAGCVEPRTNILKPLGRFPRPVRRALSAALVLALLAGAFSVLLPAPPAAARGEVAVYMTGLNWPIALGFASDGRIFMAERLTGSIRIIRSGTLLPTPFYTLPNTATAGERGLLGLALDPGFPATPWVYAYQTYNDAPNATVYNRVVRIQASGDVGVAVQVILAMPPLSGATNHNGGVIAFGPDGKLYVVVGENANQAWSQDPMSVLGKVLRLNPDGTAPNDNPFYGSLTWDNRIFTYGHRNMFGLAFHPVTNRLYVTENGPNCNDEINLLTAGANYGWGSTATCATPPPPPNNTNRDGPSPVLPIWWWAGTICPTNAAIYGGPYFPAWRGDLFMGDCNFGRFHRLHLVPPAYDTVASDDILWTAPSSIIEVEQGPDGAIWFTTPTTIYRYWDSGRAPVAAFTANPNPTNPGVPVAFDASGSTDPDGTIVSYAWDFGDATTGAGVTTSHAYAIPGTYPVALTVVDNETFSATATRDVVVQSPAYPVASFTVNPVPVNPGLPVTLDASGSYDPDGTIVSYDWDFGDSTAGTGPVASHAYPIPGVYTVTLTVTDNASLASNTSRLVLVNAPPRAAIAYLPTIVYIATPVAFDGRGSTDPDGTIASYDWDFGDSTTGTGAQPTHAYARKGPFTVSLTVTDPYGLANTTTAGLVVRNRPPRITSSVPGAGPVSATVGVLQVIAIAAMDPDGDALTYTWSVDGTATTESGTSFNFSRATPGTYTVNVTVSDGEAAAWREWTVTVTTGVAGAPVLPGWLLGLLVIAIAAVLGIVVYVWWARRRRERGPVPPPPPV